MRKRLMHSSMNKSNYYDIEVPQNQPLVKSIAPMNYSLEINHNSKKKENFRSRDHMRYSSNIETLKTSTHRIRHTLLSKSKESEKQKQKLQSKHQRKINLLIQRGQPVQRQKSPYNHVIDLEQIQENPTFSARRSVLYPNMDFKRFVKHFSKKQQQQQDSSIFFSDKINQLNMSEVVRKATHTSNMKVRTPFVHFNLKFLINKKKNLNLENQTNRITGSNLPYYQTLTSDLTGKEKGLVSQRTSQNSQIQKNKYRSIQLQLKLQNIQKQVKQKDFY